MALVVIDTNVLLSAAMLPKSKPAQAVHGVTRAQAGLTLAMSDAVWAELMDVLYRPKLDKYLSSARRAEFVQLLEESAQWMEPSTAVLDCRDLRDNKFLELALAAETRHLVSGDADLLVLTPWRGIQILTPAQFISTLTH